MDSRALLSKIGKIPCPRPEISLPRRASRPRSFDKKATRKDTRAAMCQFRRDTIDQGSRRQNRAMFVNKAFGGKGSQIRQHAVRDGQSCI